MKIGIIRCLTALSLILAFTGCAGGDKKVNSPGVSGQSQDMDTFNFVADTTPLPDYSAWLEKAKSGDSAAQFIVHMMYRDDIGGIGSKLERKTDSDDDELQVDPVMREIIRWRDGFRVGDSEQFDSFIYARLAAAPSLYFELDSDDANANKPVQYGDNEAKAREYLEETAKRGYGNAELILGLIYWNALGVNQDKAKAIQLIRRAAEHGIPKAQFYMGMIYELGLNNGIKNNDKSRSWLEKAMASGNKDAYFVLGMKYYDGLGIEKDKDKALAAFEEESEYHAWSKLASESFGRYSVVCSFTYDKTDIGELFDEGCGGESELAEMVYTECGNGWVYDEEKDDEVEDADFEACAERIDLDYRVAHSLPYKIDYVTSRKWLEQAAGDPNHDYSRMVLSQIYLDYGCRGGKDTNKPETMNTAVSLLNSAVEHNVPGSKYAMGDLYYSKVEYVYDEMDEDDSSFENEEEKEKFRTSVKNSKDCAQKALEWFTKAADEGDENACMELSRVYSGASRISDALRLEGDSAKAFEYSQKAGNKYEATYQALEAAREARSNGKEKEAAEWYVKAIDLRSKDDSISETSSWYTELADLYLHGKDIKNSKTAMEYYHKAIDNNGHLNLYPAYLCTTALNLSALYSKGDKNVKKDKKLALQWYKRVLESGVDECRKNQSQALDYFNDQPNARIKDAVEFQVKLEHGKKPGEFFVIKSGYKVCEQASWNCPPKIDELYRESVQKAIIGITAWSMARLGKVDLEYIDNTFYELAFIYGKNDKYRAQLSNYSPAWEVIHNNKKLSQNNKMKLFYIWYLRQIPYAAAEEYKSLNNEKPWDDYMKEAKKTVKNTKALSSAFNYDLLEKIQRFPDDVK